MCGIVGFAGSGSRTDLAAMMLALAHRGPDGEGSFCDVEASVYLGHRRLAIVDLDGGAQPMWSEDDRIGVIFNGELYNHLDLRKKLKVLGHVFRTDHSDTEVLIHGYKEWGEELPLLLNGMFAFAIYDRMRKRLFLARDRFGEKPLYFCHRPGLFAFASELSGLRHHRSFDPSISRRSLQKFFAYGYIPSPNTIYATASKLPGGSQLTYDIGAGKLRVRDYWRLRVEPDPGLTAAADDRLAEELRYLVLQSVKRRLMSDVPLGVFLSGGVDSASALAAATQYVPSCSLKTFTIGFAEPSFDESDAARDTARYLGSDHRERLLSMDAAKAIIPEVLERLDEPLGDPSILPTSLLSRFAREEVTVAISGDGGDELFAGYDPFRALELARWYDRVVPGLVHRSVRSLVDLLPASTANMSFDFKLKRSLMGLSYPANIWNPVWMAPIEPALIKDLFHEPLAIEELYSEAIALWDRDPHKSIIDRTLEFFSTFYLQDNILTKVDRATMMVSLESRAIFLDNDLVEFSLKLPSHFKYRNGTRKYLLKKAMAPLLPKEVVTRPKKGFGIPLAKWLRSIPRDPSWIAGHGVKMDWLNKAWDEHHACRADSRQLLWCWLSFQEFLYGDKPEQMVA